MSPLDDNGNNVDYSQRHAPSMGEEDDPLKDPLIRGLRSIEGLRYWHVLYDREKAREFLERFYGKQEASPQEEPEEKPFDQDAFFNDIEEMRKQVPKKL